MNLVTNCVMEKRRGRPAGYSPKLGRKLTPEELANKPKHNRGTQNGKVGRPKGYSYKLGRQLTPEELAEREYKQKNKTR